MDRSAGESVTRALRGCKDRTPRRPFFFWLHLYDPHSPYDPPEPFRTEYRDAPYDGEIAYADHELGRLIAWLKQNHLYDGTADCFSERSRRIARRARRKGAWILRLQLDCSHPADRETARWKRHSAGPGGKAGGDGRCRSDYGSVLARHERSNIQKQFQSPGLFGKRRPTESAAYSESFYSFSSFGWSPLHALETSRYHYIEAPAA